MRTHRLVSLTRTDERLRLGIVAVSAILLAYLLVNLDGSSSAHLAAQQSSSRCNGGLAGVWKNDSGSILISRQNYEVEGEATIPGIKGLHLTGKVDAFGFSGNYQLIESSGKEVKGQFSCSLNSLVPAATDTWVLHLTLSPTVQFGGPKSLSAVEDSIWYCDPSQAQPSPSPIQIPSPTPNLPIQIPSPTPNLLGRDGRDTDNFATFDALPKAEQEAMLSKRGPRVQKEYQVSHIEMRVFVKGGLPIIVDYGLSSDAPAYLSIGVGDDKPFVTRLDPAKLAQVRISVPNHFGPDSQVGKLSITAYTSRKEPANFQLYGIAFGEAGAHALNNLIPIGPNAQHAVLAFASGSAEGERRGLFAPTIPQDNNPVVISVSPPLTIQSPKKKPKKFITFSFTSRSLYDNGCWELLHIDGGSRASSWQKDTGSIRPNKQKLEKWDGIISVKKLVLAGDYELRVRAWRGDVSGAAVIARALSDLTVIE